MAKHACSSCENEFDSEDAYLNHTCEVTGFQPTKPQHHGEQFVRQSIEALKRGGSHGNSSEVRERKKLLSTGIPHEVSNRVRFVQAKKGQLSRERDISPATVEERPAALASQRFGKAKWTGERGNAKEDVQGGTGIERQIQ